jgi:tyrosyl-tRNA synthetase
VRWQSEWFGKFSLADVIKLTSKFTVAQLLAREDFSNRYSAGRPIAVTELLYPLLQAYDSVMVEADVEFGGIDQKFNLLMGRELQSLTGQLPQQCFMSPLLVGTDGTHKMSKSLGNYIGIAEPPNQIYGKVMSLPDSLIIQYFELLTDVSDDELEEFKRQIYNGAVNPMLLKKRLARELVAQLHDCTAALEAEEHFNSVFQKRELPGDLEERRISLKKCISYPGEMVNIGRLITEAGLASSTSEAFRLIKQGAVSIDGKIVPSHMLPISEVPIQSSGSIIKAGKRRFARVINID